MEVTRALASASGVEPFLVVTGLPATLMRSHGEGDDSSAR